MRLRLGLGPVFEAECLRASRRVSFYVARVALVAGLLAALVVVWGARSGAVPGGVDQRELAAIGQAFYGSLMGMELALAVLLAPASAAGALCQDRARGGLALLLTTDLSRREIVLGRLASRLLATLGVVAAGLPVLALTTWLGGVDPMAVAGGSLVVVGVASVGVAMALTFSLWAGKPHEALAATYGVWAVWLLALPVWEAMGVSAPAWLHWANPLALIYDDWLAGGALPGFQLRFFAASLAGTAALTTLATWSLRAAALGRGPVAARSPRRRSPRWLRWIGQASPDLDDDPALWREWHRTRPSAYARGLWWTYAILGTALALWSAGDHSGPMVGALLASVGLLLACVDSASSLADERAQGGLDVVLATPLGSRQIALAKWRGAFRVVPRLAILPAWLAWSAASERRQDWPFALGITALVYGLVLGYGAVVVGWGLLMAIGQPRPGRAIGGTVGAYVALTIAYPTLVIALGRLGPHDNLPTWPSPFFGILFATQAARSQAYLGDHTPGLAFGFLAFLVVVAYALWRYALRNFDRGLGRVAA